MGTPAPAAPGRQRPLRADRRLLRRHRRPLTARPAAPGPPGVALRIFLLADTHLGIDSPARPRVARRRRGDDFMANYLHVLERARTERPDLLVHGGDVFFRARVAPAVVEAAAAPLRSLADSGVPVFVVPGNHERSRMPAALLTHHPGVHVFHEPGTVRLDVGGRRVAVSGFPCIRRDARARFPEVLAATGWRAEPGDVRLLCMHQTVEGARVGPSGYTFRRGADVIAGRDLPAGLTAVLAGHIHRHQVLGWDLAGAPLAAPVLYPGSIERTSFAERDEDKGFLEIRVEPAPPDTRPRVRYAFRALPARPMVDLRVAAAELEGEGAAEGLRRRLGALPTDAVVRVQVEGTPSAGAARLLEARTLRALAPRTMNVSCDPRALRRDYRSSTALQDG